WSEGQFVPLRLGQDTVVFPGYDGGAEWGGQAFEPASGLFFVNANDLAWTGPLAPNPPAVTGRELFTAQCATCHEGGAAPALTGVKSRRTAAEITAIIQNGSGRMPGFPNLRPQAMRALTQYLITGESAATEPSPFDLKYRFTGYKKFLDPD